MHSVTIVSPKLCLKMPAGKCLAESASWTFFSICIYLRISMSSTMPVTYLRISRL